MTDNEREILKDRLRGFTGYCGIVIDGVTDGVCRAHVDLQPQLLNPRGFVHGGLLCTLMDVAAGSAAILAHDPPRMMVTQSAEVHYLRPCSGGTLTAEARVLKAGRSVAVVSVEVKDEAEKLVSAGTFELFYLTEEKP